MKKIYRYIGFFLGLSLAACSTDNALEAPLQGELGNAPDGTISPNPYWSWVTEFPGFVNVTEPRIETSVLIKGVNSVEDTCWRSTGLYVVPGDTAVVNINGAIGEVFYRIGGFTEVFPTSLATVKRYRDMNVSGKLVAGENKLLSYFGGHLYVYFKGTHSDVQLQVSGVVKSPDFVAGETDVTEWKALLDKTSVPFGELRSAHIILTLPLKDLKAISDPAAFLQFYDEYIVQDCGRLYGERNANAQLRIRTDFQFTASVIDSRFGGGYPIVVAQAADSAWLGLPSLTSVNDFTVCQSFSLSYSMNEITADIFRPAYYGLSYFRLCDRKGSVPANNISSLVNSFVNSDDPARRYTELSMNGKTAMFVQLAQEYGWNIYTYISDQMKKDTERKSEQNHLDAVAMYASEYANGNLLPFFEDWGVVLSPNAQNYMSQFPVVTNFWKNYTQKAGGFDTRSAVQKNKDNWPEFVDASKTGWTATSTLVISGKDSLNVHDEKNNKVGPFKYLFDGNAETMWHSLWKSEGGRYPHALIVNMVNEQTFNYLYFQQRNNTDPTNKARRFKVYVKEADKWVSIDNEKIFTLGRSIGVQKVFLSKVYTAKEVKVVLLSPHAADGARFNNQEGQSLAVSLVEFGVGLFK